MPIGFVDVHRAPHRHGARYFVVIRQRLTRQWFDRVDGEATAGVENSVGCLPGDVLDRQQGGTVVQSHSGSG